jgi:aminopeptidase N
VVSVKTGRGFAYPEYEPFYPPEPPYELLRVKAEIDVDLASRSIEGKALNVLRCTGACEKIVFHAVDMKIEEVRINGKQASYTYTGKELEIYPEKATSGDILEVQISYKTVEPRAGVWFIPTDTGKPYLAYTQGQPEDTRFWLPTYDFPNRKTVVELVIRAPKGLKALSNGKLIEHAIEGEKEKWVYRLDSKIPTYLIAFAVGDFYVKEEEYNGVLLQYAVPKGREADIERSFSQTKDMIRLFEEYTGVKYPYPKYSQVCVDDFVAGGMENASITILTSATLHDEKAHIDFRSEPLVSHELAHQWFGDLVTCKDWSHLWLNEGFATLMEAIWRRHELGKDEFVYDLIGMMDSYLAEYGRYARPIVTRVYKYPDEMFDSHSYPKAALVLWSLASIIGEENFRKGVKRYLEAKREQNAETEEFRRFMEEASGLKLDWFFEQYVYNAGHPSLKVSYKWDDKQKILELKITQTQGEDSLPKYRLPLELVILGQDYKEERKFLIDEKQYTLNLQLPSKPKAVCIDPEFKILKALSLDLPPEELLAIIGSCPYLYPRVVAARELSKKASPVHIDELAKILLAEEEFWGLRSEVAQTIGSIGGQKARDTLLNALSHVKHPRVRRAIVRALANFKEKPVADTLSKILLDENESYYVRAEAAAGLGKIGLKEYVDVLARALETKSHNHVIAATSLDSIALLLGDEALATVEKYLSPDTPMPLRRAAIASLGYMTPTQRVISLLEEASRSRHPHVKLAVVSACTRMLSPKVMPILEKLQQDVSGRVARNARDALEQVRKHVEKGEEYRKLREEIDKLKEEERRLSERIERLEKK